MNKVEMPNVEVLRKTGYKVRVYHGRTYLRSVVENDNFHELTTIMSKREYEHYK